ncbi:MAG TPA: RsmF rRNA methyltransferase first C-terminal domain-containing protein [Prevotella sp.]
MILPKDFETYTRRLMGSERYNRLVQALQTEPHTFVRTNPLKAANFGLCQSGGTVEWYEEGHWLNSRPAFTFDPLLHAGLYYVQEKSSMFLAQVLRRHVSQPVSMLDMCAAPGGKSTLARMVLPQGSLLMCNEPMRQRAQVLAENVQKCGVAETIVTNNYPEDYARSGLLFDVILCDVPCSGEGMFRKDAQAIEEWSAANVDRCTKLQRDIVNSAWQCLQPGGLLVYSTCTFNTKENEENVEWLCNELGAQPQEVGIREDWNICGSLLPGFDAPVYRFIPGFGDHNTDIQGEGLFMALLRKPGVKPADKPQKKKEPRKTERPKSNWPASWLTDGENFCPVQEGNRLLALPQSMSRLYAEAAKKLRILHAGVCLGEVKGKDVVPDQSLALSVHLNADAFPAVEISYEEAIAFLRKEAVMLPADTPRGFVLLTYKGLPLGFEKNLGNRANNLYPQEWRIKSSHLPETAPRIYELNDTK